MDNSIWMAELFALVVLTVCAAAAKVYLHVCIDNLGVQRYFEQIAAGTLLEPTTLVFPTVGSYPH